jgi:hypothetical protein
MPKVSSAISRFPDHARVISQAKNPSRAAVHSMRAARTRRLDERHLADDVVDLAKNNGSFQSQAQEREHCTRQGGDGQCREELDQWSDQGMAAASGRNGARSTGHKHGAHEEQPSIEQRQGADGRAQRWRRRERSPPDPPRVLHW